LAGRGGVGGGDGVGADVSKAMRARGDKMSGKREKRVKENRGNVRLRSPISPVLLHRRNGRRSLVTGSGKSVRKSCQAREPPLEPLNSLVSPHIFHRKLEGSLTLLPHLVCYFSCFPRRWKRGRKRCVGVKVDEASQSRLERGVRCRDA
jgi:hypothetical protein